MRAHRPAAAVAAALAIACGGDRGTAPTPPRPSPSPAGVVAGAVVRVVRGDTGAAVEGATVIVAGRTYVADASGSVRLEEAAAPGALVDVVAVSALDRQTVVRNGPLGTVVLWPRTTAAGIDEAFTAAVVYTRATLLGAGPAGAEPLRRFAPAVARVVAVPAAEILEDERAHAAHITGVERLNAAAGGAPTYVLAREAPASGEPVIRVRIGPEDPSCIERVLAFARVSLRSGEITAGEIVYCLPEAARVPRLVVHELGHTIGLQHSEDSRDMMFGTFHPAHAEDFRPREVEVMALVRQRRAGNRFPDSDREVAGASNVMDDVVVCY